METKVYSFHGWVEDVGIGALSRKLKVHTNTIRNWLRGTNDPRVNHMRQMYKLSRGQLPYQEMIERKKLSDAAYKKIIGQTHNRGR